MSWYSMLAHLGFFAFILIMHVVFAKLNTAKHERELQLLRELAERGRELSADRPDQKRENRHDRAEKPVGCLAVEVDPDVVDRPHCSLERG